MKNKAPKKVSARWLRSIGLPATLIPGIMLAAVLGWQGWKKLGPNYYANESVFPTSGVVREVTDGDTFTLQSGVVVRLIGVDAPGRGEGKSEEATEKLSELVQDKRVYLEYDRYQDDKYGRILAWVWINCESEPEFLPADYMHLSANASRPGLTDNPSGCKDGQLVQEELVNKKVVSVQNYQERGKLKYQSRLEKAD